MPLLGEYTQRGGAMGCCDPLALTTAISALAVALSNALDEAEIELAAAVFTQLGDMLATISVQKALCQTKEEETTII